MGGLVSDLATTWDLPQFTQGSVFPDARDYTDPSRKHQSPQAMTPPRISEQNMADDSSFIKQVQTIMKTNPISPPYPGPIDGKVSRKLLDVLLNFQWTIQRKTGKTANIVSGNSISGQEFSKAMKILQEDILKEKPKDKEPEKTKEEKSELIKSFQSFLSKSNPIIGAPYKGEVDGISGEKLAAVAKSVEAALAVRINNKRIYGALWNNSTKTFNTTVDDLRAALELIMKYEAEKKKKAGLLKHNDRISKLARLI
jgi:hypothetical protein